MKKGQGLSLNTIIIAAIVLIVLVVLWAIFTGRMGTFASGVKEVEKCSNACTNLGYTSGGGALRANCAGDNNMYLGTGYVQDSGAKFGDSKGCCCTKS